MWLACPTIMMAELPLRRGSDINDSTVGRLKCHVSHSLSSLKGYIGDYVGDDEKG